MTTSIVVDPSSLRIRETTPATGDICLLLDSKPFPTESWNDFVVVVLGWWTAACARLLLGHSEAESVDFMDGPFTVELSIIQSHTLSLRAMRRGRGQRSHEVASADTSLFTFLDALLSASHAILDACRERNHWSPDVRILQHEAAALGR